MVARYVVLKAMRETPVFIYRKAAGLINVMLRENGTKNHACMNAKCIMDAYPDSSTSVIIANPGRFDVILTKYQGVGEITNAPKNISQCKRVLLVSLCP